MIARLALLVLTAWPRIYDSGDNDRMLASVAWIVGNPILVAGLLVAVWKTFVNGRKLASLLLAAASNYNPIFLAAIIV